MNVDNASGIYRFKKIYPGENWDTKARSPLTEPGVKVKEGDYLIAVNGRILRAPQTPFEFLDQPRLETECHPDGEPSHRDKVSHTVLR